MCPAVLHPSQGSSVLQLVRALLCLSSPALSSSPVLSSPQRWSQCLELSLVEGEAKRMTDQVQQLGATMPPEQMH